MDGVNSARRSFTFVSAPAACVFAAPAWPQNFPTKPVRYVVPFGVGGSPDIVARILAERLTRLWGQQVLVDNRAGVAGVLGSAFVATSPPDGHTLLQCNIAPNAIGVSMFKKLPYDQLHDFALTRIGLLPNVLLSHPSLPVRSIKELIAYARAHPGELNYSSGQVGTSPQLSFELLKLATNIKIVNIPFKIGAQGLTDTIGGQITLNISNLPQAVSPIQDRRLRGLAVTSAKRAVSLPSVPTMQESGIAGFEINSWYGVCAPSATPTATLDKLNEDITLTLRSPEINKRLSELLNEVTPTTREEFDGFIREEISRWARVIKDANIPQI
jgi:tripartite-type tricarboxylate transporter receptor subunit TctC